MADSPKWDVYILCDEDDPQEFLQLFQELYAYETFYLATGYFISIDGIEHFETVEKNAIIKVKKTL